MATGPQVPWLPPTMGHIAIGLAVATTRSTSTTSQAASGALSFGGDLNINVLDAASAAEHINPEVSSEEVDYGPLLTLVGLTSGAGCLVLAFVTAGSNAEEGVFWGVVGVVIVGILYMYGNLDPIARWVAEQKRKHRR